MDTFSAGAMVRFGWETFKKRSWFLIGAMLSYFVVVIIIGALFQEFEKIGPLVSAVCSIANWVVQALAGMGMISFLLKAHDDVAAVALRDFWHPYPFWKYVGATILKSLVAAAPLAVVAVLWVLSVPAAGIQAMSPSLDIGLGILAAVVFLWMVYISIRFLFVEYYVIDKNAGPTKALDASTRAVRGYGWKLLWLLVLLLLLNLLGVVCIVVGLLVSVPVSALAIVHAYRQLEHRADEIVPATA